jgi:hypothetical protein
LSNQQSVNGATFAKQYYCERMGFLSLLSSSTLVTKATRLCTRLQERLFNVCFIYKIFKGQFKTENEQRKSHLINTTIYNVRSFSAYNRSQNVDLKESNIIFSDPILKNQVLLVKCIYYHLYLLCVLIFHKVCMLRVIRLAYNNSAA